MISEKDKQILRYLRKNARTKITDIAKETGIPASTIYDRVRINDKKIVKKHTTLVDFTKLGFNAKAQIALKVSRKDTYKLYDFLKEHTNVNSLYRVNFGFDFLIEVIFQNMNNVEDFIHEIESKFDIEEKHIFNVIDEIKREAFMI